MNEFVKYSFGNDKICSILYQNLIGSKTNVHRGEQKVSRYNLIWFGHASGQKSKPFMMYAHFYQMCTHSLNISIHVK
jgi:hypothetical protein